MRIMVDFIGGPFDGSSTIEGFEKLIRCGPFTLHFEDMAAILGVMQTSGAVGEFFEIPSRKQCFGQGVCPQDMVAAYKYKVAESVWADADAELLVRAEFTGHTLTTFDGYRPGKFTFSMTIDI